MSLPERTDGSWRRQPVVHEVNTWVWLRELGARRGQPVTLADVGEAEWEEITPVGVDAVWLMGVWERSPAGLTIAWADARNVAEWRSALPDLTDADVVGSPYSIRRYVVDESLGGPDALAVARRTLARRGVRLVLDFVPNHIAPDNLLVEVDGLPIAGTVLDLTHAPGAWMEVAGRIVARGRDPFFPPWADVVQLDAFSPAMRAAMVDTLDSIAGQCDGVRCDVAMLLLDDVFAATWDDHVGAPLALPFWTEVIGRVRTRHPEFWFCAEVYWNREWDLQQQGFDHTYDKRAYDCLVYPSPRALREHLAGSVEFHTRNMHFLENHDEKRAAALLPPPAHRSAAIVVTTLPGAVLVHEGELDGRRVRLPVFLTRRPPEPVDRELRWWWLRLLALSHGVRTGRWRMIESSGWAADQTNEQLVSYAWRAPDVEHLVVVNLSEGEAHARVRWAPAATTDEFTVVDLLSGEQFERSLIELLGDGLYVSLGPWQAHILRWTLP